VSPGSRKIAVIILGHGFTDRHDSVDIRSGCDSCVGGDYSYLFGYYSYVSFS